MSEEPNTKIYFDGKIVRVVFKEDVERKVYWVDTTDFHSNYRHHLLPFYHFHHKHFLHQFHNLLPIEEWLKDQGMTCVEDDMMLFELTWV